MQEKTTFSIRIKISLLDWLREQAEKQDRSVNYYINKVLEAHKEEK